ncbi:hypothetical protein BCR39DRAFT_545747 [Naematelia encephala]|uniref:NAD(P)-binding domain-containing protein n=1 Tax=Naematelia encephala TaxID=71784 RepID=A0A1Y2AQQ7_9TREE|nr:hypothetical protein BCR39DRAFT_545747 [Naematelia encephala]
MKVFLTGASGRLGTHIIPHLVARGHTVTGLVRSQASANVIKALGSSTAITPLVGSLEDTDLLISNAKSHDAVIHCAMDHKSGGDIGAKQEQATIKLFGDALEGSGKALLMSSGTGLVPKGSDETARSTPGQMLRPDTEVITLGLKDKNIRSIVVRLAMNTHDIANIHIFEGMLLGAAAEDKLGYIPYIGDNVWSACHADDAGLLYVLAMEKAEPGTVVHAVAEFVKVKDIAEALAKRTGFKTGEASKDKDKFASLGWLGMLLQWDNEVKTQWTKETFGWEPKGQGLLEEFTDAPDSYFK